MSSSALSTSVIGDRLFYQYCNILKVTNQIPSDPDRRQIEKAFRKCALKTHPDKPGGDAYEFRRVQDAYKRLMAHITCLEAIEAEAELSQTSVIIEISKQASPGWADRLRMAYGKPKTSNAKNPIFEGPFKQFKGRGGNTGPITIVLYEDPEDKVPKLHIRCDNYMIWIQEQKLPLHLHVQRNKKISFDQWRIMSMAEFGFCKVSHGSSARHDWKQTNAARAKDEEQELLEKAKKKAEEEERERLRREKEEEERKKREAEEAERKRKESENVPFWSRFRDRYGDLRMGETTPPPEDIFPKVYNMTSNCYAWGGISRSATPAPSQAKDSSELMDEGEEESVSQKPTAEEEKRRAGNSAGSGGGKKCSAAESVTKMSTKNGGCIKKGKSAAEEAKSTRRRSLYNAADDQDQQQDIAEEGSTRKRAFQNVSKSTKLDFVQNSERTTTVNGNCNGRAGGISLDQVRLIDEGLIDDDLVREITDMLDSEDVGQRSLRDTRKETKGCAKVAENPVDVKGCENNKYLGAEKEETDKRAGKNGSEKEVNDGKRDNETKLSDTGMESDDLKKDKKSQKKQQRSKNKKKVMKEAFKLFRSKSDVSNRVSAFEQQQQQEDEEDTNKAKVTPKIVKKKELKPSAGFCQLTQRFAGKICDEGKTEANNKAKKEEEKCYSRGAKFGGNIIPTLAEICNNALIERRTKENISIEICSSILTDICDSACDKSDVQLCTMSTLRELCENILDNFNNEVQKPEQVSRNRKFIREEIDIILSDIVDKVIQSTDKTKVESKIRNKHELEESAPIKKRQAKNKAKQGKLNRSKSDVMSKRRSVFEAANVDQEEVTAMTGTVKKKHLRSSEAFKTLTKKFASQGDLTKDENIVRGEREKMNCNGKVNRGSVKNAKSLQDLECRRDEHTIQIYEQRIERNEVKVMQEIKPIAVKLLGSPVLQRRRKGRGRNNAKIVSKSQDDLARKKQSLEFTVEENCNCLDRNIRLNAEKIDLFLADVQSSYNLSLQNNFYGK